MGIFSLRRKPAADTGGLGTSLIALRLEAGDAAPVHSTVVVFNAGGHARRAAAGKVACEPGEMAVCFHPGPYTVHLTPFAAAPEWALRLRFVVDVANPRVAQQRFDLYLYSEMAERLDVEAFRVSAQSALQIELAQGALDLPPCTSLEEWHAFRAGLNQLMYTRFGVTVDDCVPVDLGDQIDFADVLKARAAEQAVAVAAAAAAESFAAAAPPAERAPVASVASVASPGAARPDAAPANARQDAFGLRRLFLELPSLSSGLRVLVLPEGLAVFQQHQALLLRLGMAALNVNTMPSLAWAAPDQPLPHEEQARRTSQTLLAVQALDEAWALLARLQLAAHALWPGLLDEADRICANLETGLAFRRAPYAPRTEPTL
ncbi:hypothetical protein [Duganella sp. HH105]|uniref:hypothetical protein n=1 Tax=Duganella sp. HH105 TaxID=1781067 RepID=UPI000877E22A|nr:hypothetical protein [Duganella sp. HH105]OEZ60454.1 hypothetical protein DUGA6_31840 [Duganella sp. HH105]